MSLKFNIQTHLKNKIKLSDLYITNQIFGKIGLVLRKLSKAIVKFYLRRSTIKTYPNYFPQLLLNGKDI